MSDPQRIPNLMSLSKERNSRHPIKFNLANFEHIRPCLTIGSQIVHACYDFLTLSILLNKLVTSKNNDFETD